MKTIPTLIAKIVLPVSTEAAIFISPAQMIGVVLWVRAINNGSGSATIKIALGTTNTPANVFITKTIAAGNTSDDKIWIPFKNGDVIYGVSTVANVSIFISGIVGK